MGAEGCMKISCLTLDMPGFLQVPHDSELYTQLFHLCIL